jgi:hypothetical protein
MKISILEEYILYKQNPDLYIELTKLMLKDIEYMEGIIK